MCSKLILIELPLIDLTDLLKVALQTRHLSFGTDQNHKACRELKPTTEETLPEKLKLISLLELHRRETEAVGTNDQFIRDYSANILTTTDFSLLFYRLNY